MLTHQAVKAVPSRVALLGAQGFLASRLRAALEQARTPVRAIGSRDVDLTAPGAGDALRSALREGDSVVFLSAITPEKGKGIEALMANLRMAEQVCAALAQTRVGHVVYISSDAVYRETEPFIDERGPADSPSLYGTMHALRERMLMQTLGADAPLAVLRPTLVFGAGDTHNSYGANRFMRAAAADRRIPLFGQGEEQRDHVYADDVVRIIQRVIEQRSSGVLNVVTGQSVSFGDLARKVAAIAGDVVVECRPRAAGPILHRHYDPTALFRAFPDFRFTPRDEALAAAWRGYVSPA
jgi:nucleoside-diphosphate-sugar epimerase